MTVAFDLTGLSRSLSSIRDRRAFLSLVSALASLHERHYPEALAAALVTTDANWLFQLVLGVVARVVADKTLEKIRVVGARGAKREEELRAWLPEDTIRRLDGEGMTVSRESIASAMAKIGIGGRAKREKEAAAAAAAAVTSPTADGTASGPATLLVSNIFSTLPGSREENTCRQRVPPQCSLSFKFNVCRSGMEIRWYLRVDRGGDVLLAVTRRATVAETVNRDKVSSFVISSRPSPAAGQQQRSSGSSGAPGQQAGREVSCSVSCVLI